MRAGAVKLNSLPETSFRPYPESRTRKTICGHKSAHDIPFHVVSEVYIVLNRIPSGEQSHHLWKIIDPSNHVHICQCWYKHPSIQIRLQTYEQLEFVRVSVGRNGRTGSMFLEAEESFESTACFDKASTNVMEIAVIAIIYVSFSAPFSKPDTPQR